MRIAVYVPSVDLLIVVMMKMLRDWCIFVKGVMMNMFRHMCHIIKRVIMNSFATLVKLVLRCHGGHISAQQSSPDQRYNYERLTTLALPDEKCTDENIIAKGVTRSKVRR